MGVEQNWATWCRLGDPHPALRHGFATPRATFPARGKADYESHCFNKPAHETDTLGSAMPYSTSTVRLTSTKIMAINKTKPWTGA